MTARRWAALVVPFAALAVAALLFWFREPVLRSVELPVAYLVWAARVAAAAIGQRVVWVALVVLAAAYGLGALRTRRSLRGRPAGLRRREALRTRISYWESCLSRDTESWLSRQLLAADLRRLAARVLSHTDGLEASDLEGHPRGGALARADLPACLRELFDREREQPPARLTLLSRLFRRRRKGQGDGDAPRAAGRRAPNAGSTVAEIIEALEKRLSLSERKTER